MIGLTFLAIGLLWLALSVFFAIKLPKWFGATKPVWRRLLGGVIFVTLMIGPFVDHIVGMRQFEKLCAEQTGLQILSGAANTKKAKLLPTRLEPVNGFAIPIEMQKRKIANSDSGEVIASYNYFTTGGGKVGGLLMLGGQHTCSINQPRHPNHNDLLAFENKVNLTYGETK
jgi:hypothetical protein